MMKTQFYFLIPLLAAAMNADAATVYAFWSGQDLLTPSAGTPGVGSETVSRETFPGTPTLTTAGSARVTTGGAATFTAYDGSVWTGSGGSGSPGYSFGYNPGSNGNNLILTFSMAGLQDLALRMDIRAGINTGATRPTAFTAIEYDNGDGGGFRTAASGAGLNFGATNNNFTGYNLDLSALDLMDDRSTIQLRFSLPNVLTDTSIRLDNIQISALEIVPEPASAALAGVALGFLSLRRRRA